jgi:hypothetical protein
VAAFGQRGFDWTIVLRRQPARIVDGQPDGGYTDMFEIICCDCGDHPDLDYRQVSPELQRIRGPYPVAAGVAAYEEHLALHRSRQAIRVLDRARHDVSGRLFLVLGPR